MTISSYNIMHSKYSTEFTFSTSPLRFHFIFCHFCWMWVIFCPSCCILCFYIITNHFYVFDKFRSRQTYNIIVILYNTYFFRTVLRYQRDTRPRHLHRLGPTWSNSSFTKPASTTTRSLPYRPLSPLRSSWRASRNTR